MARWLVSTGENAWLAVIERYENNKRVEEYKATHGGRAPPDPPLTAVAKTLFPCFFREKVHIVMGYVVNIRTSSSFLFCGVRRRL